MKEGGRIAGILDPRLATGILACFIVVVTWGCDGNGNGNGDGNGEEDDPDVEMPSAELSISQGRLEGSARVDWIYVQPGACSLDDVCSEFSGWRRVIRFSTEVQNIGPVALKLGSPEDGKGLVYHDSCRDRAAVGVAPLQELLDSSGNLVRATRARPWCWADTVRLADAEGSETAEHPVSYQTCAFDQGISPGWASIQASNVDCQLLDVTALPAGFYTLRLTLDPDGLLDFEHGAGRIAEVSVRIGPIEEHQVCIAGGECFFPVVGACEGVSCPGGDGPTLRCEEGDIAVAIEGPGICHPVEGTCIEHRDETRCADAGQTCIDGECVDLCGEIVCEAPSDYCLGHIAVTHSGVSCDRQTGTCFEPVVTETDCEETLRACVDGGCVNLCRDVSCPGDRFCRHGNVVIEAAGTCDWETGLCIAGEQESIPCDEGEVCEDGWCVSIPED